MENIRIATVLTALTISVLARGEYNSSYWKNGGILNSIYLTILFSTDADNQELCCVYCQQESACYVMAIDTDTKTCTGYSKVSDNTIQYGNELKVFYPAENNCDGDGYIFDVSHYLCYRIHTDKKPWQDAMSTCHGENGRLIFIDTSAKLQFVRGIAGMMQDYYIWVGGKRAGENKAFHWLNGNIISLSSDLWGPGEPNDEGEECLAFWNHKMNDVSCFSRMVFICVK